MYGHAKFRAKITDVRSINIWDRVTDVRSSNHVVYKRHETLGADFSGYAFAYGPKTTGATYGPSVNWLVRLLAAGQKKLGKQRAKNNTYKSKIKIPTLCCCRKVDSCLHCKFRNGAFRRRAAFHDSVLRFED